MTLSRVYDEIATVCQNGSAVSKCGRVGHRMNDVQVVVMYGRLGVSEMGLFCSAPLLSDHGQCIP
jgi:hypothetical protein